MTSLRLFALVLGVAAIGPVALAAGPDLLSSRQEGQAADKKATGRDFFVSLKAPAGLQEGDLVGVLGRVHNLTEYEGDVFVTLQLLGGAAFDQILSRRKATVNIARQSVLEVLLMPIAVPLATARVRLQLTATSVDGRSDTLRRIIPVRPWGLEFAVHQAGEAKGDTSVSVSLPPDRRDGPQSMTVTLRPIPNPPATGKVLDESTLTILVNGRQLQRLTIQGNSQAATLRVPTGLLASGKNVVDFRLDGRGEYAFDVTLRGLTANLADPKSWAFPYVLSRRYFHTPLEYRGQSIGVSSTTQVKDIEVGQRVDVQVELGNSSADSSRFGFRGETVIDEPLPSGLVLVEGSLSGSHASHVIDGNRITLYFPAGHRGDFDFHYQLVGHATGEYLALPTVIRDAADTGRMRIGTASLLRVLAPGENTTDAYRLNDAERFWLGLMQLEQGEYREGLRHLGRVDWQGLVCQSLAGAWPSPEQSHHGLMLAGHFYSQRDRPEQAAFFFSQVPHSSRQFAQAQLAAGRGYWRAHRNAALRPDARKPSPRQRQAWLAQSTGHMQSGIARIEQETPAAAKTPALKAARVSLAKVLVDKGEYQQTFELLTGKSAASKNLHQVAGIGAVDVENRDVQPQRPGYLSAAYARQAGGQMIQAYVGTQNIDAGNAVWGMLLKIFATSGDQGTTQANATMGRQLEKELARLKAKGQPGQFEDVFASYEEVLEEVGVEADDSKFGPMHWAAESHAALGSGLKDGQEPAEGSQRHFESASGLFEKIIRRGEANKKFVPGGDVDGMKLRLADCQSRQGKFATAIGHVEEVLDKDVNRIDAQVQAASVLQDWGSSGQPGSLEHLLAATNGRGNKIWGWKKTASQLKAQIQDGGASDEDRERFREASFNVIKCQHQLGRLQADDGDRTEELKSSKQALEDFVKDSSDVPPEWQEKFNDLYRTIQEDLDESDVADLQWPDSQVAQTQPDEAKTKRPLVGDLATSGRWWSRFTWLIVGVLLAGGGTVGALSWKFWKSRRESSGRGGQPGDGAAAGSADVAVERKPLRRAYARLIRRFRSEPRPDESQPPGDASTKKSSPRAPARQPSTGLPATKPESGTRAQAPSSTPPPKIDEYQLTECLATGKSSKIWEARGPDDSLVAIKLLQPESRKDPVQVAALRHEAKVARSLDHPNLVKFHKTVIGRKYAYIVMDCFPSQNVKKLLALDLSDVQVRLPELVDALCLALRHMHDKGWVHHGLKPGNILFNANSELRLIDFSLSTRNSSRLGRLLAGKATIQGTRTYIAPETLQRKHPTPQTDMYSLGITIFELLTGVPPFDAASPKELLKKHLQEPAPPPSEFHRNVGPDIDRLVQRLLQKQPKDRYKSMREVIADFRTARIWKEDIKQYLATEEEAARRLEARSGSRTSRHALPRTQPTPRPPRPPA